MPRGERDVVEIISVSLVEVAAHYSRGTRLPPGSVVPIVSFDRKAQPIGPLRLHVTGGRANGDAARGWRTVARARTHSTFADFATARNLDARCRAGRGKGSTGRDKQRGKCVEGELAAVRALL